MNKVERQNYQIGFWISVSLHLVVLILFSFKASQTLLKKPVKIDTFSVGIIELPFGDGVGDETGDGKGNESEIKFNQSSNQLPQKEILREAVKPVVNQPKPALTNSKLKEATTLTKALPDGQAGLILPKPGESIQKKGDKSETENLSQSQPEDNLGNKENAPKFVAIGLGTGEGLVGTADGGGGGGGGRIQPAYPKNAVNEGKEGEVLAKILVEKNGTLEEVKLTKSSGDERLDKAVLNSIQKQWKFKAAGANYYIEVLFSFKVETGVSLTFLKAETRS